jgi:hypothetical protein
MTAVNSNKMVYALLYGSIITPLTYIAEDNSFVEFCVTYPKASVTARINSLKINSDSTFTVEFTNALPEEPEYNAIILKSSTIGSTKKFKLTVDDDGILSTEELTE